MIPLRYLSSRSMGDHARQKGNVLAAFPTDSFSVGNGISPCRKHIFSAWRNRIISAWRIRSLLAEGWGCRDRHPSRARRSPDRRCGFWTYHPGERTELRQRKREIRRGYISQSQHLLKLLRGLVPLTSMEVRCSPCEQHRQIGAVVRRARGEELHGLCKSVRASSLPRARSGDI